MGLLSLGTPLPWEQSRLHSEHVRNEGLQQLQMCFQAANNRKNDAYLWGDEVEYMLVKFDDLNKKAKLAIDKDSILDELNEGGEFFDLALENDVNFHPEYGRFMLESTPAQPYNGEVLDQYLYVEKNMSDRRVVANIALRDPTISPITVTAFPLLGRGSFTSPESKPNGNASRSLFLPDEIINRHVRFPTLTANIRKRRGEKVAINIPMFKDEFTPTMDDSIPLDRDLFPEDEESKLGAAIPHHIYMDSMGFGMGDSCLQITVQAPDISKARYLYDSWINFAPVFLSLSAAAPIFKGWLSDQDVRWNVISMSVDDRTPYERDAEPLKKGNEYGGIKEEHRAKAKKMPKSRYDSVDGYLGDLISDPVDAKYRFFKPELNDINPVLNEEVMAQLSKDPLFDKPLASHFAHLYIRDPIVIFNETIKQDVETETNHFENIQSTNWQTLRFKPPTQSATADNKSVPGWRVEFRSMEIQITDFENAAFSVFIALLGQALLANSEVFNFYVPISKVEENMRTAHKRNSITELPFHFKKDYKSSTDYSTVELSLDEIINGGCHFTGLIPLVKSHLKSQFGLELAATGKYSRLYYYFALISKRASGEIPTAARFIRDFITSHPEYKKDSRVNETMNFDLLKKMNSITNCDDLDSLVEFFGEELGGYLYVGEKKLNGVNKTDKAVENGKKNGIKS